MREELRLPRSDSRVISWSDHRDQARTAPCRSESAATEENNKKKKEREKWEPVNFVLNASSMKSWRLTSAAWYPVSEHATWTEAVKEATRLTNEANYTDDQGRSMWSGQAYRVIHRAYATDDTPHIDPPDMFDWEDAEDEEEMEEKEDVPPWQG